MKNYGIPYMGSKSRICDKFCHLFTPAKNFYDLFGGGFSVSHWMTVNRPNDYERFHYNEIKSDIVELVKDSIDGKFNYDVFKPEWVSREYFVKLKDTCAYTRVFWSFGNYQKTYLFCKSIEQYKKSMHMAVVFNQFDELSSNVLGFDKWPDNLSGIKEKRLFLRQKIESYRKTKIPDFLLKYLNSRQLQQLQQLQQLERLQQLQQLQQLERLEQLQQLQRLESLEKLSFSSLDYRKVSIKENSIVYCDIPYKGTADYIDLFNHKEFYDWAISRTFPVYISEYEISDPRFKLVYSVEKRSMLSSKKTNNIKQERLYWNGVSL